MLARRHLHPRSAVVAALVGLVTSVARAEGPAEEGAASMQCDRAAEPGRVRCTAEFRPREGLDVRFGDVVIRRSPDFAQPLKGRLGPEDVLVKDAVVWRWALALVARRPGKGELVGEVRVVLCPRDQPSRCVARAFPVRASVVVGP